MSEKEEVQQEEAYEEGITWRSLLAIAYSAVVMFPVCIYLYLVMGVSLAGAASYTTAILFIVLTQTFGGKKLTKQETFIIYMMAASMAGWVASAPPFLGFIEKKYFMTNPVTLMFTDPYTKKPLPYAVPWWWGPPYGSPVYNLRGFEYFFNPGWIIPWAIMVVFTVIFYLCEVPLAFLCIRSYLEIEELPFPLAAIDTASITTLAEREWSKMKIFALSSSIGMIGALITYGLPTISSGVFNIPLQIVPWPWIDLNPVIERILPGAMLAITADVTLFITTPFVIPSNIIIGWFIGSISVWVFGNWLANTYLSNIFPVWHSRWTPGMSYALALQQSQLWVWLSPYVGFAIAVAIIPMVAGFRFIKMFRRSSKQTKSTKSLISISVWKILLLYFTGIFISLGIFHYFVPEFPIWIPFIISGGWSLLIALASTRILGETGTGIGSPPLMSMAILSSGYPKIDVWYAPLYGGGGTAPWWTQSIRVAQLTKTKPMSYFKGVGIVAVITVVLSFVYVNLFWIMAPIPSSVYPRTAIQWPLNLQLQGLWVTRELAALRMDLIVDAFFVMLIVAVIVWVVQKIVKRGSFIPIYVSLVSGCFMGPNVTIPFIIGVVINYMCFRFFGKEWWGSFKAIIAAGILCGEGVTVGVCALIALIAKSIWLLPY